MKARKLRKLLGGTGYIISNDDNCICVGSPLCHNLISVDKQTLKVKYALDTFHHGRESIKKEELVFIWDTLHRLIDTGEITEIIGGRDLIENPLPVFTVRHGELAESVTDKYGWPNTDDDGMLMYDNTHFPTKEKALEYGIRELSANIEHYDRVIGERKAGLAELKRRRKDARLKLEALSGMLGKKKRPVRAIRGEKKKRAIEMPGVKHYDVIPPRPDVIPPPQRPQKTE
jgi:hypothetical protein